MKIRKYIYILVIIILALIGYFYFSKNRNTGVVEPQGADMSDEQIIDPKEILKYDPNAPAWMQDAESCKIVAGKVYCKIKGE